MFIPMRFRRGHHPNSDLCQSRRNWLNNLGSGLTLCAVLTVVGCTPTVKVEAPDKPITINLNVKLDAEVRVKLEEKAEEDVQTKPIF